ncbi:MAG: nucleoside triphosphate pyrophosphohydrolase [Wenzhouxiangellaceae bacterium]
MQQLRNPETGCPWDLEQDFASIAPYTIEEAYEVADAIERQALDELKDELGDLLFQVVFHSQLAAEQRAFAFPDVVASICDKMIRRHPHVFADHTVADAAEQTLAWEQQKAAERSQRGAQSALDGVPRGLPELSRAVKLQKRAARVGFDWEETPPIFAKLDEEIGEMQEAVATGDKAAMEDELGDLLFVCANLARRLNIDPGRALRRANAKFERRFRGMEAIAGDAFAGLSLEQKEDLWQIVKAQLKAAAE